MDLGLALALGAGEGFGVAWGEALAAGLARSDGAGDGAIDEVAATIGAGGGSLLKANADRGISPSRGNSSQGRCLSQGGRNLLISQDEPLQRFVSGADFTPKQHPKRRSDFW